MLKHSRIIRQRNVWDNIQYVSGILSATFGAAVLWGLGGACLVWGILIALDSHIDTLVDATETDK